MFKKILVPVDIDYPDTAALVYRKARAIAELSQADIHIVTVMPGFSMPMVAAMVPKEVRQQATARIQEALEQFVADNCEPGVTASLRTGKNWEEIIKVANAALKKGSPADLHPITPPAACCGCAMFSLQHNYHHFNLWEETPWPPSPTLPKAPGDY